MGHLLGAITQEKLDEQRGVVQNEKRQSDSQPYGLVEYRYLEGVFPPGHPYRHSTIGSMADLNAASLDDVHQWFKDYYGAANTVLVLPYGDYQTVETQVDRSKGLPAVGDLPDLSFPEIQRAKLKNGLDISLETEKLGARISTASNLDMSTLRLSAMRNKLAPSLELFADVVRNPAFDQAEIDRLRPRWIARIKQEKSQPVQLALRNLPPLLYGPDHAYGIPLTGSHAVRCR